MGLPIVDGDRERLAITSLREVATGGKAAR